MDIRVLVSAVITCIRDDFYFHQIFETQEHPIIASQWSVSSVGSVNLLKSSLGIWRFSPSVNNNTIQQSWRLGTEKQYSVAWRKWYVWAIIISIS